MSNRNDPETSVGAMIFAGFAILAMLLFFIAGLLALVLTVACIFAWQKERQFFGHTITPYEAHRFVGFGIACGIVLGLFGAWMYANDMLLAENRPYMPLIGYVIGSLGWGLHHAENEKAHENQKIVVIPPPQRREEPPPRRAHEEVRTFQFASWDDEEPRA